MSMNVLAMALGGVVVGIGAAFTGLGVVGAVAETHVGRAE